MGRSITLHRPELLIAKSPSDGRVIYIPAFPALAMAEDKTPGWKDLWAGDWGGLIKCQTQPAPQGAVFFM